MVSNYEPDVGPDGSVRVPGYSAAALVAQALEAARDATDSQDRDDEVWGLLVQAAADGPGALSLGTGLLASTDPISRATGCALLGRASEVHEEVREEAATALLALASTETDDDVLWSLARALGDTQDHRAVSVLLALAEDDDPDIRGRVAQSLAWVATGDFYGREIDALIRLTRDPDPQVRNWATFGLGSVAEVDTRAVRDALWDRTGDDLRDAREEAIHGLARRHDPRATALVIELLEAQEGARVNTFHAAASLGDPALLRYLENYDPSDPGVAEALLECDPASRARRDDFAIALLDRLSGRLPEMNIALLCDRFDIGLRLQVTDAGQADDWAIGGLFERAGGDPEHAAELIAADLTAGAD